MLRQIIFAVIAGLLMVTARAQETNYIQTLSDISTMLSDPETADFSKAVFMTENAFFEGKLDEIGFEENIKLYASICKSIITAGNIEYTEKDRDIAAAQCATFVFMTDTVPIYVGNDLVGCIPFQYNHDDFAGQNDWSNMFVSKLMETNRGNCHSLPYLYKLIMDELGYESHLALAPNHIYIKAMNKKVGWYNIELTCGDFPADAWYAASGYIHTDAIRNGIYMRALSQKEAIAMTLVDLAQGYQAKFGIGNGDFMINCCDTALNYFPGYINAKLLKAEILSFLYQQAETESTEKKNLFIQMNKLYTDIHQSGYRKMPRKMYDNWINSLNAKERNQEVKAILNPRTK